MEYVKSELILKKKITVITIHFKDNCIYKGICQDTSAKFRKRVNEIYKKEYRQADIFKVNFESFICEVPYEDILTYAVKEDGKE